jgi:aldose 1-epimerase
VLQNDLTYAKIVLNQGASLQELTLNSISVIQDLYPLKYENTFASSILFPFASRIKNGKYLFEDIESQTETNELERNNSLHGFVYNKEF